MTDNTVSYTWTLSSANATNDFLLNDPRERGFGPGSGLELEHIRIRLGERPTVRNLIQSYKKQHKSLPPEYQYDEDYDIYLVTMSVGLLKDGGWKNINQLGVQLEYKQNPKVTILDLAPKTEFVRRVQGRLRSVTHLSLNGRLTLDEGALAVPAPLPEVSSAEISFKTSQAAKFLANLEFNVLTPTVIATGVGHYMAEWILTKDEEPLVGDQAFAHVLLVPKDKSRLNMKARVYAIISGFFNFFPVRLEGEWVDLPLEL